jgi:AraC-like DNA-binding protein
MSYAEQRPAPAWTRWVECGWCAETTGEEHDHDVRPDGCLDIIYSPQEGLRVVGTMTASQRYQYPAGTRIAGVRFQPGMAGSFLGAAPSEFTDGVVPLDDIWGSRARRLEERLRLARTPGETMRLLLLEGIPAPAASPSPVQCAIEAIAAGRGCCDLDVVADQASLSPRQFRRRCLEESGLTPKHLSRVLRFRYACGLAHSAQRPDWTDIALEAGYFDQAHLIRDFHEFAGGSPMAVFSKTAAGLPG